MQRAKLSEALKLREIFSGTKKNSGRRGWILRSVTEGVGILLAIGFLFYNNVLAGLVFFPYLFFYVRKRIKEFENKRREKLAVEFKDGMQAVVSALIAGYSIENAFREYMVIFPLQLPSMEISPSRL